MSPQDWEKLRRLKEFIDKGAQILSFPGPIVVINPEFVATGNYVGIAQEQIDNTVTALNSDLRADLEALADAKANEFANITYSPPIT